MDDWLVDRARQLNATEIVKDSGGRPPHEPTEQSRKFVKSMLGDGLKQPAVCAVLDISENTLRNPRELESAEFEVHAMVGQSLVFNAIGGPDRDWREANIDTTKRRRRRGLSSRAAKSRASLVRPRP
jgi:hypothetical protein